MPNTPKTESSPCDSCGGTDASQREYLRTAGTDVASLFGVEAKAGKSLVSVHKLQFGELALCAWCRGSCDQVFGDPVRERFAPAMSKLDRLRAIIEETD